MGQSCVEIMSFWSFCGMRWLATATLLRKHACALHIKMTDYNTTYKHIDFLWGK